MFDSTFLPQMALAVTGIGTVAVTATTGIAMAEAGGMTGTMIATGSAAGYPTLTVAAAGTVSGAPTAVAGTGNLWSPLDPHPPMVVVVLLQLLLLLLALLLQLRPSDSQAWLRSCERP